MIITGTYDEVRQKLLDLSESSTHYSKFIIEKSLKEIGIGEGKAFYLKRLKKTDETEFTLEEITLELCSKKVKILPSHIDNDMGNFLDEISGKI